MGSLFGSFVKMNMVLLTSTKITLKIVIPLKRTKSVVVYTQWTQWLEETFLKIKAIHSVPLNTFFTVHESVSQPIIVLDKHQFLLAKLTISIRIVALIILLSLIVWRYTIKIKSLLQPSATLSVLPWVLKISSTMLTVRLVFQTYLIRKPFLCTF